MNIKDLWIGECDTGNGFLRCRVSKKKPLQICPHQRQTLGSFWFLSLLKRKRMVEEIMLWCSRIIVLKCDYDSLLYWQFKFAANDRGVSNVLDVTKLN